MKIELKAIRVAHSLSEETNAYTATVYVDGQRAFEASNHGTGGGDDFRPLPGYTGPSEREISAWLKANMPPLQSHGMSLDCDLELLCGEQVDAFIKAQEHKRIRAAFDRMLTKQVGAITPDGRFVTFGTRYPPKPDLLAKIKGEKPDYVFVNDADEPTRERALQLYCPDLQSVAA